MAPRTTRRRTIEEETETGAIDAAMESDREKTAEDLASVLESIAGITGRDLKMLIYRIPKGIGKWEYCTEVQPPFETSELMDVLKEQFGPGDYALRIMVEGKIKTTRNFSIAADRKLTAPKDRDNELLPLLISTLNGKSSETMQMMMAMMNQQAQQSQQQMQMMMAMMQNSQASQSTMITALMGGREKPAELIAAFAPLMAPKTGGFGETVEMIKALKELIPGGGGGDDDGDLVTTAVKSLGPMLGGLLAARQEAREHAQPVQLPPVREAHIALPSQAQPMPVTSTPTARFPVLSLIASDVLFYFSRQADPDFAAEGVFEVMKKADIKPDDFAPVYAAFMASENWVEDLAAEGIDLRSNPKWAQEFLNAIIQLFAEHFGADTDSDGGNGSPSNAGDNGEASESGVASN